MVSLCLGLLNALACVTSTVEPAIEGVEPAVSYTDGAVRLTIHTSGVRGNLDIHLGAATDTRANNSVFQLLSADEFKKPSVLTSVVWSDEDVFMADVPLHLEKGRYAVKVTNPDGRSATSMMNAFESLGNDNTPPTLNLMTPPDGTAMAAGESREALLEVADGFGWIIPPTWTIEPPEPRMITTESCVSVDHPVPSTTAIQHWKAAFIVPFPAATQAQAPFDFTVVVTDGGGNYAQVAATFHAIRAPEVVAVEPAEGGMVGGAPFSIRGANFVPGTQVLFGDSPALEVDVPSSQLITGHVPPHDRAETVPVTVESLADQRVSLPRGYHYLAPPRVRGVEPATGPIEGDIPITAKGTDFRDTTTIFVGTGPDDKQELFDCKTVLPPNKVTGCLKPASSAGTVKVWAEDLVSGGSDADAVAFTYAGSASAVASSSSSPSPSSSPSTSAAPGAPPP